MDISARFNRGGGGLVTEGRSRRKMGNGKWEMGDGKSAMGAERSDKPFIDPFMFNVQCSCSFPPKARIGFLDPLAPGSAYTCTVRRPSLQPGDTAAPCPSLPASLTGPTALGLLLSPDKKPSRKQDRTSRLSFHSRSAVSAVHVPSIPIIKKREPDTPVAL
jgi:hypothetical protein